MRHQRCSEVFGGGAHAIGTDLHQTEPFQHRRRLGERVLRRAQQRQQFLQSQADAAGGDLQLLVKRRVIRATRRAVIDRSLQRHAPQDGCDGGRAQPHIPGARATRTGDIRRGTHGCGERHEGGQQRIAQIVKHAHDLGFHRLERLGFVLHPCAQGAGKDGHLLGHLLHECLVAGGRCGTIRHALLLD
jgi:hypothetical protein